jgi:hypothetical protein
MGDVVECSAHFNEETSEGKALLETEELIFRGSFRVKVPLKEIRSVKASDGQLLVRSSSGLLALELGPKAEKWADKILHPKSVIDKLGVKPGQKAGTIGVDDQSFLNQLTDRGVEVSTGRPRKESDVIFLMASDRRTLEKLSTLKSSIKKDGAIWVIFPKGRQEIRGIEVLQKGREVGLVDTKVVAFSSTCTAHKFVIRLSER